MYNMMLGPCGEQFWAGGSSEFPNHPLPRARFHMDYSRVAFPVGVQIDPLYAFSYAISAQQPAAITASIGATQADILDTTISEANTLSKTCIATHLGVTVDRVGLNEGTDTQTSLLNIQVALPRIAIRVKWAERGNEECVGLIEDFPEGIGILITSWVTADIYMGHYNGMPMFSAIKPLPRPLPCKGGDTFFQVAFEPSVRDGGVTHVNGGIAITSVSYTARVYGVGPSRVLPSEAPKKALQALAGLQAEAE